MTEKLYKLLHEKGALQRYLARHVFFAPCQRLGFHITGDHFYELVPNTRMVAARYRSEPRDLLGIEWRLAECEQRVLGLIERYGAEYLEASRQYAFRERNPYFRGFDALTLYLMLRDARPSKVVEIGQGFSTRIILAALTRNAADTGRQASFVSIDPYARFAPQNAPAGVAVQVIQQELQTVDIQPVVDGCRFLFVDSSHVYKFASDVAYEFTRLYPRLEPETMVHLHDVFSPYDYPVKWIVKKQRFWNEQYILESFLMFNRAFEVVLPVHLLAQQSLRFRAAVQQLPLDPDFKHNGSSFYFCRR